MNITLEEILSISKKKAPNVSLLLLADSICHTIGSSSTANSFLCAFLDDQRRVGFLGLEPGL